MPSSLAMHTMSSQESLHNNMNPSLSNTVKRVHFAPLFEETRRHSSQSLDSIPESSSDSEDGTFWSRDTTATSSMPTLNSQQQKQQRATQSPCPVDGHEFVRDPNRSTQSCACGKLRHSDIRHAAHRIPGGKTRRESVEAFDDVKKRWYLEYLSDSSAVVDEPWGSSNMDVEASLPVKFGVHHW